MKLAGRNSLGCSSTFSAFEQRLELRQRLLQIQRHRARVGAELALDHQEHTGHAVDRRRADRRRGRFGHLGDIAQPQRLALAIGEQRARQLLGRAGLALDVDEDVLVGRLDETRRAHPARPARSFDEVLQRQPVAQELVGIGLDLPLAHLPAEHVDVGDALYRHQVRPDGPVHQRAHLHQRALLRGEPHAQHRAGRRSQRCHGRLLHTRGQPARQHAQPLAHHLAVAIDVRAVAEHHGHHRQRGDRLGPDDLHARCACERVLDRLGDLPLDQLGRQAGRFGLDHHLAGRELREHIEIRAREHVQPVDDQRHRQGDDHPRVADGLADDEGDHLAFRCPAVERTFPPLQASGRARGVERASFRGGERGGCPASAGLHSEGGSRVGMGSRTGHPRSSGVRRRTRSTPGCSRTAAPESPLAATVEFSVRPLRSDPHDGRHPPRSRPWPQGTRSRECNPRKGCCLRNFKPCICLPRKADQSFRSASVMPFRSVRCSRPDLIGLLVWPCNQEPIPTLALPLKGRE